MSNVLKRADFIKSIAAVTERRFWAIRRWVSPCSADDVERYAGGANDQSKRFEAAEDERRLLRRSRNRRRVPSALHSFDRAASLRSTERRDSEVRLWIDAIWDRVDACDAPVVPERSRVVKEGNFFRRVISPWEVALWQSVMER